ncbi:hypothetical protein E2C01_085909 [Portunus trituberculatus]|uniref:Uncharacterized protein n=1 Tax=Portunus trituberculatus TaxID=210409 RepID=A0A5B7J8A0_PORTR|nr:hypothetical protein [Portunus trituberculatus]
MQVGLHNSFRVIALVGQGKSPERICIDKKKKTNNSNNNINSNNNNNTNRSKLTNKIANNRKHNEGENYVGDLKNDAKNADIWSLAVRHQQIDYCLLGIKHLVQYIKRSTVLLS